MLRLRRLTWLAIVLVPAAAIVRCGGDTTGTDGGADGGTDASLSDAGRDARMDSGNDVVTSDVTTSDVVTADVATDVSNDSPADAPADAPLDSAADGGWTVASISGLVLWLDAAKGVSTTAGSIDTWADQSGQGNNAAAGAAAPTLVSSSINSLPAAHFVASSQQYVTIADATSLQWGTGDYTIAVVAKFDNSPDAGVGTGLGSLYTKLGTSSGLLFFANDLDVGASIEAGTTVILPGLSNLEGPSTEVSYEASYNDGTARLYAVQRVSGTETLRVDGIQVASSSSSVDVTETGVAVNIGALVQMGSYSANLDGDIAEMVAVRGTLASSDLSSLESYLKSKYAL